jgi:hypothetical protein
MISTKKIEFVHGFLEELEQALRVLNPKRTNILSKKLACILFGWNMGH